MRLTTQQTIMAESLDNVEDVDFAIWYLLQKRIKRICFGLYNPPYYLEEHELSKKIETELEIIRNYDDEKA